MLGGAMYTTIKVLGEKGYSKLAISKMTGVDRKTVRKVLAKIKSGIEYPNKKDHPCKLDAYKDQVLDFLGQGLSSVRIHEELLSLGSNIGYSTVKFYVARIKKREDIFVKINTKPGEESQVDFGYVGLTINKEGKKKKTWAFNMRLGYSRYDYYELVYDQRVETFINCHINAFRFYGGVPEYVVIDNLKAAVLEANFYEPVYQDLYKNFAEFYNFKILPCRVRDPNRKGKVESGIKFIKNNFFVGRKFLNYEDLKSKLNNWIDNRCNNRLHGTTRKVPYKVFIEEEREKLILLPIEDFKMNKVGTRKVYHDCHVYVDYNYYSVPFEYVGKEVEINVSKNLIKISCNNKEIAVHSLADGRGSIVTNDVHYPKYKRYSETENQEEYQIKVAKIGAYAEQLFFIIIKNHPNDWKRYVLGLLSLNKKYSEVIINLACKRAIAYNVYKYRVIKNMCENGSYNLPIEFNNSEVNYEYA